MSGMAPRFQAHACDQCNAPINTIWHAAETEIRKSYEDAAVFAFNAPLSMVFTRLHSNNCTDRLKGGSTALGGCIKIGSVTSVRLAESSAMTETVGPEVLLEEWNSTLYTGFPTETR
jgi:hypothetical protein